MRVTTVNPTRKIMIVRSRMYLRVMGLTATDHRRQGRLGELVPRRAIGMDRLLVNRGDRSTVDALYHQATKRLIEPSATSWDRAGTAGGSREHNSERRKLRSVNLSCGRRRNAGILRFLS